MTDTAEIGITRILRCASGGAAVFVCAVGALILCGWIADLEVLKSLHQPVPMNPITAVSFILCGASLLVLRDQPVSPARSIIGRFFAIVVVTVATLRLIGFHSAWNVGVDTLLFPARLAGNRIAPNTALNFLLIGFSLLLLDRRIGKRFEFTPILVAVAASIALLALTGYLYAVLAFYGLAHYNPMALNTAIAFLLLSAGIIAARPNSRPLAGIIQNWSIERTITAGFGAALCILSVIGVVSFYGVTKLTSNLQDPIVEQRISDQTRWTIGVGGTIAFALVAIAGVLIRRGMRERDLTQRKLEGSLSMQAQMTRDLERAMNEAVAANRSKSEFLANMSHEIRTPMTAILGYSEMLLDPEHTSSDRLNHVNVIRRNGAHLLTIINDILDISKIEAGQMTVERVECSPSQILSEVASMMRVRASERSLKFLVGIDGEIPTSVRSDPTRLRQILINLVGNAIKFTDAGSVQVKMRCDRRDHAAASLVFQVIDTGLGMNDEQMSRIFAPFTQADSSMTRRFGGTGLGLSISKRLANMLGGELSVKSELNHGSVFTVTIDPGPLAGVAFVNTFTEAASDASSRRESMPSLRGRILLAEDGLDNQQLLAAYLRRAGATVELADNGKIACEKVAAAIDANQPFDLIIMDMQMPELDGYGAASKLRARRVDTPIVALTAHAMSHDRAKCIHAGCTDFLSKPVSRHELVKTVAKYLHPSCEIASPAAKSSEKITSEIVDDEDVKALLPKFVEQLPGHVQHLADALAQDDLENLQSTAHKLVGTGGLFGFPGISKTAAKAEKSIRTQEPLEEIHRKVQSLCDLIRNVEGYDASKEIPGTKIAGKKIPGKDIPGKESPAKNHPAKNHPAR